MKLLFPIIALSFAASGAYAQTPAAPPAPSHAPAPASPAHAVSVETTPIDELLQNPKAMELVIKHFPEIKGSEDQLAQAGSMTMRDIQAFAADAFTDEKLAALEADFKAMPQS